MKLQENGTLTTTFANVCEIAQVKDHAVIDGKKNGRRVTLMFSDAAIPCPTSHLMNVRPNPKWRLEVEVLTPKQAGTLVQQNVSMAMPLRGNRTSITHRLHAAPVTFNGITIIAWAQLLRLPVTGTFYGVSANVSKTVMEVRVVHVVDLCLDLG